MQRALARVPAGQRERDREPALGVGVGGAGVAERAQGIRPPSPHRSALLDQFGIQPFGLLLELREQRPHRLRCVRHAVDAVALRLLDEIASPTCAELPVVGLGDESLGHRIAVGEAGHERPGHGVGRERVDARQPTDAAAQPRAPVAHLGVAERGGCLRRTNRVGHGCSHSAALVPTGGFGCDGAPIRGGWPGGHPGVCERGHAPGRVVERPHRLHRSVEGTRLRTAADTQAQHRR